MKYQLTRVPRDVKIHVIKEIRAALGIGLGEAKNAVEQLPWAFDWNVLANALEEHGCTVHRMVGLEEVIVAIGLWQDPQDKTWKAYAEGGLSSRGSTPDSVRADMFETTVNNGFNQGEPIYVRFLRGDITLPSDVEPEFGAEEEGVHPASEAIEILREIADSERGCVYSRDGWCEVHQMRRPCRMERLLGVLARADREKG